MVYSETVLFQTEEEKNNFAQTIDKVKSTLVKTPSEKVKLVEMEVL